MARVYNPEPKPNTSGDGQFWGVLVWKEVYCKGQIRGRGRHSFGHGFDLAGILITWQSNCVPLKELVQQQNWAPKGKIKSTKSQILFTIKLFIFQSLERQRTEATCINQVTFLSFASLFKFHKVLMF